MWLDITVGGNDTKIVYPDFNAVAEPTSEAGVFLKLHETARIVVIIDTHCLENSAFVWAGNSLDTYKGCFLYEVSMLNPPAMFTSHTRAD